MKTDLLIKLVKQAGNLVILVLILITNYACNKDDADTIPENYSEYLIELYADYTISKVTVNGYRGDYTINYVYSEKTVRRIKNKDTTIYYLNSKGLADSSISTLSPSRYVYKYYYDDNNYRIRTGNMQLLYADGNCITDQSTLTNYGYSSIINLIDIFNFNGIYLGKLNKNLVSKSFHSTTGTRTETNYSYNLNSLGLVINREIFTTVTGMGQNSSFSQTDSFKYIIK